MGERSRSPVALSAGLSTLLPARPPRLTADGGPNYSRNRFMCRRNHEAIEAVQAVQTMNVGIIDELISALRFVEESDVPKIHAFARSLLKRPLRAFPPFKSVDQALAKVYEVRAASGVKTAAYGIQTAASSVTDRLTAMDRVAEATWVFNVVDDTLSDIERAVVTCKYDGLGSRDEAIELLTAENLDIAKSRDLVRELLIREFDFGETYAKSLPVIARETDCALRTVERAAQKARRRIADLCADVEGSLRAAFELRGWIASGSAPRFLNA